MTGDELEALKDLPVPEPREGPRAAALAAALAAFDAAAKKADSPAQENASSGRLTLASTQTQRRRLMRANFFNYKIAASIAALVVAVPAALYMLRQERPPAVPQDMVRLEKEKEETKRREMALLDEPARLRQELATQKREERRPDLAAPKEAAPIYEPKVRYMHEAQGAGSAASGENLPAGAGTAATPGSDNKASPVIRADAQPAKDPPARPDADQSTVVRSESYSANGNRIDSRPLIKPTVSDASNGLPYPSNAPVPAAPPPAPPQTGALKELNATISDNEAWTSSPKYTLDTPGAPKTGTEAGGTKEHLKQAQVLSADAQPAKKVPADPARKHRNGERQRLLEALNKGQPSGYAPSVPAPSARLSMPGAGFTGGQHSAGLGRRSQSHAPDGTRVASGPVPADSRSLVLDDNLLFQTDHFSGHDVSGAQDEEKENRDQFEAFASNSVKQVAAEPVSTFSIDVDTASYSFVRRSLLAGRMPPKDAVRVEEMINYFPYAYPRAESAGLPFLPAITVTPSPWKPTNKLVHIGIKGYEIAEKERPRANLVLLIDVSGSMAPQDRLPLLKNAFRMLLGELKPDDTVGIVTYASQSGVALEPTRVAERGKILDALNRLNAGGSTSGGQGLQDAYRLAEMNFDKNAVNRIILATDGDFNVGITDREELKRFIEAKRQTGIYLSVIGVGQDNYNDRLMQALAQNGNGVAAYVDTLNEARKVLVDEASSSLFPIAQDVKIQIEFNPARVSEYRLIGYETRALKREDFNNDKVDAGDIGSGHTVTAIYEITPVGAPKFVDDLRYQKPEAQPAPPSGTPGELGFLKIRYKLPGEETSKLITTPIAADLERADVQAVPEDVRFSIAVAAFGQLLRGEPYLGAFSFDDVIALAQTARGADRFGYRAEFLNLVRLAKPARR
jgi:Ca-activated chloride channel homolog